VHLWSRFQRIVTIGAPSRDRRCTHVPLTRAEQSATVALMAGYTVVDVETTGYSPAHHDRVVEIALVRVSERGEI